MATTVEVLRTTPYPNNLVNTAALAAAATIATIPLHIAAAFAQSESGGRNVYGNDLGGTYATPGAPDKAVTAANYAEFYRLVVEQGKKSNGVGPMQITWRGYHPQARAQGLRLWFPFDNYLFGFRIIAANLRGVYTVTSVERAATLYNKGNMLTGVNDYGRRVAARAGVWRGLLSGATAPRNLQRSSVGPDVATLQAGLLRRFPSYAAPIAAAGGADGKFGPATEGVVREFQRRVHITSTGVVEVWTRGHLSVYGIEP